MPREYSCRLANGRLLGSGIRLAWGSGREQLLSQMALRRPQKVLDLLKIALLTSPRDLRGLRGGLLISSHFSAKLPEAPEEHRKCVLSLFWVTLTTRGGRKATRVNVFLDDAESWVQRAQGAQRLCRKRSFLRVYMHPLTHLLSRHHSRHSRHSQGNQVSDSGSSTLKRGDGCKRILQIISDSDKRPERKHEEYIAVHGRGDYFRLGVWG